MDTFRPMVAAGFIALMLGEGAFFQWDYAEMLSGDPILLVILLAAVVLLALSFLRPARGLLLAAGILVSLVPIIVLFVFGAVQELADPGSDDFLGVLLFLVAIALALPAAILGFRRAGNVTP